MIMRESTRCNPGTFGSLRPYWVRNLRGTDHAYQRDQYKRRERGNHLFRHKSPFVNYSPNDLAADQVWITRWCRYFDADICCHQAGPPRS